MKDVALAVRAAQGLKPKDFAKFLADEDEKQTTVKKIRNYPVAKQRPKKTEGGNGKKSSA